MSNLVYQHKSRLFLTVLEAANVWLATLSPITRKNYASGIRFLVSNKILDASMKLEKLVYVDHWDVLNRIKSLTHTCSGKPVSEASKQARAACYISFTKFLYRLTKGVIKQAIPSRDFGNSTFYKIRDKVKTEFISKQEWLLFFDSLKRISFRDYLIGKLIIQGVRKLSEVISLRTEDLLFSQNQITFKIKKRQSRYNEVRVVYPNFLMQELRDYVGNRDGWVFISGNGQQVALNQVYYYFKLAENDMNLSIKVTPHVLRASALAYLKKIGCADEAIMRVSCFSSTQMLSAYDTNTINNQTSQFPLIF